MKTILEDFGLIKIEADENMWLTLVEDNIPVTERVLSKNINLAVNDSIENWKEISQEKFEEYSYELYQIELEEQARIEAEMKAYDEMME